MAEFVNDPDKNIILLTTLHQNIEAYGTRLSPKQLNEWNKVKGRLKEVAFNEPVEQLLYLAANKLTQRKKDRDYDKNFRSLYKSILSSGIYPLKNALSEQLAAQLYPWLI